MLRANRRKEDVPALAAHTTAPTQTTSLWFLDSLVEVHAHGQERAASVVEMTVPPGDVAPLHLQDEDERIEVLDGSATFYVGAQVIHARAGDSVLIPRGRLHTHVASDFGARWLVMTEGGRFEGFVRAVGRPALARTLPPRSGRLDHDEAEDVTRAGLEHGVEYFGPPGTFPTDL